MGTRPDEKLGGNASRREVGWEHVPTKSWVETPRPDEKLGGNTSRRKAGWERIPTQVRGDAAKTKSKEKTQSLAKKIKKWRLRFRFFRKRKTALAFEQKDENGSVLGGLGCSLGRPWEAQGAKRLSSVDVLKGILEIPEKAATKNNEETDTDQALWCRFGKPLLRRP